MKWIRREPNGYGLLGSEANAIEGNKRPLSSMTPTIIFKNDEPYVILGSPGESDYYYCAASCYKCYGP